MAMNTMQEYFVDEIKDLYSAENQILKALPGMIKATESEELRQALTEHMESTKTHAQRLEQIAEGLGKPPSSKKCKGMEGLLEEGKEALEEGKNPDVLDAAIIGAAQRVEHCEIVGYGTARTHAMLLGNQEAADLLEATLIEEKEADETMTQIAESSVNEMVVQSDGANSHAKNSNSRK